MAFLNTQNLLKRTRVVFLTVGVLSVFLNSGCMPSAPTAQPRPPTPTPVLIPTAGGVTTPADPSSSLPPSGMPPSGGSSSPSPIPPINPTPSTSSSNRPPQVDPIPRFPSSGSESDSTPSRRPSPPSSSSSSSSSQSSSSRVQVGLPDIPGLPLPGSERTESDSDMAEDSQEGGDSSSEGEEGKQTPSGRSSQGTPASGQDTSEQMGGEVPQRSGDEAQSASERGAEQGEDRMGMPSSGAGEEEDGGQTMESGGRPGAGILGDESNDSGSTSTDSDEETFGVPDADLASDSEEEAGGDSEDEAAGGDTEEEEEVAGGDPNGGWEMSNQLPNAEELRKQTDQGDQGSESDSSKESGSRTMDPEMAKVLGDIDGSIRSDREDQQARANETAGGPALPGRDVVITEGTSEGPNRQVGGTNTASIPQASNPNRGSARSRTGSIPTPRQEDLPDAKDDDVVARQLREAAMAETDPELKESLWEEYRRYTEGRK